MGGTILITNRGFDILTADNHAVCKALMLAFHEAITIYET
jgi:hypothetical protein